ncbi:MAG: NUDIX hydrolase [Gemmataceae bacterium]
MPTEKRQAAAIALYQGQVCLVTSRNRQRWVVPKGSITPGHSGSRAAELEAWEEAGVAGVIESEPMGSYQYSKDGRQFHVAVYLLHVSQIKESWPEQQLRVRIWLPIDAAADHIQEPQLQQLLRTLVPSQSLSTD